MAEQKQMTLQAVLKYIAAGQSTTISSMIKGKHSKGGFFSTLHKDNIRLKTFEKFLWLVGESENILDHVIDEYKPGLTTYDIMEERGLLDIELSTGEVIIIVKAKG